MFIHVSLYYTYNNESFAINFTKIFFAPRHQHLFFSFFSSSHYCERTVLFILLWSLARKYRHGRISYTKQISAHSGLPIMTGRNILKRKEFVVGCMHIRLRGRMKIEWRFHYIHKNFCQYDFCQVDLQKSQLVNMVFKTLTH